MRLRFPSRVLVILSTGLIPLSLARGAFAQEPSPTPSPSPSASPEPVAPPPATVEVPPGAEGAGGPTGPLPVYGGGAASSKVFNPDIAVIGDFLGAIGKNDSEFAPPSLELHEARGSRSRPSSIPTRAPTSSSPSRPTRSAWRRASSPSPRCPRTSC